VRAGSWRILAQWLYETRQKQAHSPLLAAIEAAGRYYSSQLKVMVHSALRCGTARTMIQIARRTTTE